MACIRYQFFNWKCRIYGTTIDGFWIGVNKGSDASAHCISEGLLLTGSHIVNTWLVENLEAPGFAVYNISSNAFIKGNVLEANVHSSGISYSALLENNIYYVENSFVSVTSVFIESPEESFIIKNNGLFETPTEFYGNNSHTDVTCNKWFNERNAVAAGGLNEFPISWGTASKTAGNLWDEEQSAMYNFSPIDQEIKYYYNSNTFNEIFKWEDGFFEVPTEGLNSDCTYTWPSHFTEIDTIEYFLLIEDLEDEYNQVADSIAYLESNSDTTEIEVQEIIAELNRRLSELVGLGMLFHTSADSQYWNEKLNVKVLELLALNYLWYGQDMQSIYDHLISKSDPDAEVLLDATKIVSNAIDQNEDFYALPGLQIDSLQFLAESSFGNYSNLLRNYLFMVYDIFIPWDRESILDSLRSESYAVRPLENEFITDQHGFTVFPNPFRDQFEIHTGIKGEELMCSVQIYNYQGIVVYSVNTLCNGGQLNVGDLKPGIYMLQLNENNTGKRMTQQIFKIEK